MDIKSNLGQSIRNFRNEKGETLHQVSKSTDIDMTMLSKIERGERLPTFKQVKKIAKHFRVREKDLQAKLTAEKIIKDYGINETTLDALGLVKEEIMPYLRTKIDDVSN